MAMSFHKPLRDVICLRRASGFLGRLVGLLGRTGIEPDVAFLIERCRAVHTMGMREAIDVVFVSEYGVVVGIAERVVPWRISVCHAAGHVLEFGHGGIQRFGIHVGARMLIGQNSLQIIRHNEGV